MRLKGTPDKTPEEILSYITGISVEQATKDIATCRETFLKRSLEIKKSKKNK